MTARPYSNENFPLAVVLALSEKGHDVVTSVEAGNANQGITDDEVLYFATRQERAVLTLNRQDFVGLHRQNPDHGGILVCAFNPDFPAQAEAIHAARGATPVLKGQLMRINRAS
ncbi:MAG: DUF5615 family PIN-like protein [Verrucomicrobia bacterium]|nr:DUF5615 family PIN-like protein [Verrucomicrobiota bacterium]